MADRDLQALGLDAAQMNVINNAIQAARHAERIAAVEQAKLSFRAGVAGSKKPDTFNPNSTTIQAFFEAFEPFKLVMNLTGRLAVNTFLTYLDRKSHNQLLEKGLTTHDDWELFKQDAIKALSSPKASIQARFEIKRACQHRDETVSQFGQRLIDFGRVGYTDAEAIAKDSALKDALAGGVIRDELGIHLINNSDRPFQDLLAEAVQLDASFRARQALRANDKYEVTVMKTERVDSRVSGSGQQASTKSLMYNATVPEFSPTTNQQVICFKCFETGHYAPQCHNSTQAPRLPVPNEAYQTQPTYRHQEPLHCFYCGIPNHYS